jgi:NADPH:quinone reductase-like Zn-dependent oxidoreductase
MSMAARSFDHDAMCGDDPAHRRERMAPAKQSLNSKELLMRQLQLMAFGEPSDVIQLNTLAEPALGPEDVLVSMEAAPLNPSDFLLVRGIYGVRPPLPFSLGAEGVGRVTKTGSKVNSALKGRRVMIVPNYEQGTWSDEVVVLARNTVPVADDADPLQLAMIGINRLIPPGWVIRG